MPHDHPDEREDDVPQEGHADLMDLMDVRPHQMVGKGREDASWVAAHWARRTRRSRLMTLPTRRALRLFPDPLEHARRVVDVAADVGQ